MPNKQAFEKKVTKKQGVCSVKPTGGVGRGWGTEGKNKNRPVGGLKGKDLKQKRRISVGLRKFGDKVKDWRGSPWGLVSNPRRLRHRNGAEHKAENLLRDGVKLKEHMIRR